MASYHNPNENTSVSCQENFTEKLTNKQQDTSDFNVILLQTVNALESFQSAHGSGTLFFWETCLYIYRFPGLLVSAAMLTLWAKRIGE